MIMFALVANTPLRETDLIPAAIAWLQSRLPTGWNVTRAQRGTEPSSIDAFIELKAPNGTYTTLPVEARLALEPREVERLLGGLARSLRALAGSVPLLIIAPWLSERTQELLAADDLNYLDLTGNARIQLANPLVYIKSDGARRNPVPAPRGRASIGGRKAGRLVRLLADVRPPYGVREVAEATGLAPGYVSRLLDTLDRDALISRGRRGVVEDVDVAALLHAWAEEYDIFQREATAAYVAPMGAAHTFERLPTITPRTLVTGSFAAARLAPVAAPGLLTLYADDILGVTNALDLLPADEGANITLLRPFDAVVWERSMVVAGTAYAAPSQVAVDCLTGNGRMPAEGVALIDWMVAHEDVWRVAGLDALSSPQVGS